MCLLLGLPSAPRVQQEVELEIPTHCSSSSGACSELRPILQWQPEVAKEAHLLCLFTLSREVETRSSVYPGSWLTLGEPTLGTQDLGVSCANGLVPFSGPLKTCSQVQCISPGPKRRTTEGCGLMHGTPCVFTCHDELLSKGLMVSGRAFYAS